MKSFHFSIKYDGPALAAHQMDVRELAPALMALSEMLEEANKAVFNDAEEVCVNVKGNFKSGSFGIDLIVVKNIAQQIVSLFSGQEATASANLLTLLNGIGILGGAGLIGLIKWLKGRKPSVIKNEDNKTIFEIHSSESIESFEVDLATGKLYQSKIVRKLLYKVVKPLEKDGIDLFACGRDGLTESVVEKDEITSFEFSAVEEDIVSDTTSNCLLQIESAVFKDGNKWRLNDGGRSFFAEILDESFLERINRGDERFGKGDVLIVDLRQVQSITENGIKIEFSVIKVHEHKGPLQLRI